MPEKSPIELTREMFDFAKKHFSPGDMAQGFMFSSDGEMLAMLAIDSNFFEGILSRMRLQSLLKSKVKEIGAAMYVQVSDSWSLKNVNEDKFEADPPPRHASVTWMAKNGYGDLQDELLAICQMRLGVWMISQVYEVSDGRPRFLGEPKVRPGMLEPYTEVIEQMKETGHA